MAVSSRDIVKNLGVKNSCVLCALLYLSKKEQKVILSKADNSLIKSICECALNVLNGRVNLSKKQKTQLSKHKNLLGKLISKSLKNKSKKKIVQKGGAAFLPALLAPIVETLISSLIFDK